MRKNKEDTKLYNALYYQTHKAEITAKRKAKREERKKPRKQPKSKAEISARWRAKHPSYYAEWLSRGDNAEKHKIACRAYAKAYYAKHKEEIKRKAKERAKP